jgi:hypothetical protein
MSKIVTYRHDREYGYCQIKLDSGEKVLLSETGDYIKIYKLIFGFLPLKMVWKWHRTNDSKDIVLNIMSRHPKDGFFDSFVSETLECPSTKDIKARFSKMPM